MDNADRHKKLDNVVFRTQSIKRLTQPKEIRSAIIKVLNSDLVKKKCKLVFIPGEEFIDELAQKVTDNLVKRAPVQSEAEALLKKNEEHTLSSAFHDQLKLLSLAVREVFAAKFSVPVEELSEKLLDGILGIETATSSHALADKKILIVDDDIQTRKILRKMLEEAGIKVREAQHGEAALTALGKQSADLILMDINMPRMGGLELLKKLQANPQWKNIPAVVVTGDADNEIVQAAIATGAKGFIIKPFKSMTILEKINSILV